MSALQPNKIAGIASRRITEELTTLCRTGNWEVALTTLKQMETQTSIVQQNVFHYTTVINACARAGQVQQALALFQEMKARQIRPNVFTYTAIIAACGQAGSLDTALRTFAEMRLADVPPNVKTVTALITACARSGKWEKSFHLLDQCEEMLIAPNVRTYTAAMEGCRRAGVCAPALRLLATKMNSPANVRPNAITYNTALGCCLAARQVEAAQRVFAQMVADGYEPIEYTRSMLLELFEDAGLTEAAAAVQDMPVRERRGHVRGFVPDSDPVTAMRAVQQADGA
ncbi:hypothetical protein STCU_01923 [Strigomonas culicis]|uniref:PROP1-like PPR domain-containing protein n=1 Tax=Strigomonas culicis TaxID=28005 RepID=S9W8T9_9TRYP|nr:hypothetical protein STCU_02900 [Strigomonas culicis]EPY33843.1 hypothetical protein STCU_01923 [Strigomonas culicis]|eukprot:EPY32260.1 hypothetical protein STCU_02900 [Strigomonas culicis]